MSTKPTAQPEQATLAHEDPTNDPAQEPDEDAEKEIDLSRESVAGEEDPGASLDLSAAPDPATPAGVQKVPE